MAAAFTQEQKSKITQMRVLIVEDTAIDRLFLKTSLEKMGVQHIQEAVHGADGIFKSLSARDLGSPFHIILTDWKMPKKDGMAFLRDLRSERFKVRPYIIMLTSYAGAANVNDAKAAGIDDYIVKPFNLGVIHQKMLSALARINI